MACPIRRKPQVLCTMPHLPFLKADECERVKGQLSDIAQDMKEERQQSRSRGTSYVKLHINTIQPIIIVGWIVIEVRTYRFVIRDNKQRRFPEDYM